jgi:hypothetical protein
MALPGDLKAGRLSKGMVDDGSSPDDVDGPDVDNDAIDCDRNEEVEEGVSMALLAPLVVLLALALALLVEVLTLLATLFIRPGPSELCNGQTSDNVTILTPTPSLLLAGMKSVVEPSFLFSEVRWG